MSVFYAYHMINDCQRIQISLKNSPYIPTSRSFLTRNVAMNRTKQAPYCSVGRDRALCKATRYGLDDQGIESRCGRDFPHQPSLLYNGQRVSLPGVKPPGRGVEHLSPSGAVVKERVQLYFYSPLGFHGLL
jgi:hypothetical protein